MRLFLFWIRTAALSLVRSWRSTLVLAFMLLVSTSTLIFLSAMAVGVNDAMVRNSTSLYSGQVSGLSLPGSVKPESLKNEGVAGVLKRAHSPGVISNGERVEPVTMVSVDPSAEREHTALWKKVVEGRYLDGNGPQILLSKPVADVLKASIGTKIRFSGGFGRQETELVVAGIYRTGVSSLDRGVAFVPEGIIDNGQGEWQAAIFLNDGVSADAAAKGYKGYEFRAWDELMPDLKELIDLNYVSMSIVMALVFGVVSIGIAGAFSIFIFKNMREYGVMKAMGVTSRETAFLIISKVVLLNLFTGVIGTALGALFVFIAARSGIDLSAFTSHNQYFSVSGVIYPRLTPYSLCLPPIVSFAFGLVSALWPAAIVARRKPAQILRIV